MSYQVLRTVLYAYMINRRIRKKIKKRKPFELTDPSVPSGFFFSCSCRFNGAGSFGEAMDSSFSPGHSSPHSFGGRHEWSPPMASFGAHPPPPRGGGGRRGDVGGGGGGMSSSSSPPSIVGFNPPPAHAQSVNVGGAVGGGCCRSDAGREILSILSASRQQQARSWLGMSPPDRAANPVRHDLRFQRREAADTTAYGGNYSGTGTGTARVGIFESSVR